MQIILRSERKSLFGSISVHMNMFILVYESSFIEINYSLHTTLIA